MLFRLQVTELRGPEAGQSCFVMDDDEFSNCNVESQASQLSLDRALEIVKWCIENVDCDIKWSIIPVVD